eukprot:866588-Pyramimonas_sp.AAC.1
MSLGNRRETRRRERRCPSDVLPRRRSPSTGDASAHLRALRAREALPTFDARAGEVRATKIIMHSCASTRWLSPRPTAPPLNAVLFRSAGLWDPLARVADHVHHDFGCVGRPLGRALGQVPVLLIARGDRNEQHWHRHHHT